MSFVGGHSLRSQFATVAEFVGAFVLASTLGFAVLHALGSVPAALVPKGIRALAVLPVLAGCLVLDAYSLRSRSWCPLTLRRQTPKDILLRHGDARRAALAWGLDTGLVFTTIRVSSITWGLVVISILGVGPWWVGSAYGIGFVVPLALGWLGADLITNHEGRARFSATLAHNPSLARLGTVVTLAICLGSALTQSL
jgi:hypothetical protein